MPKTFDQMTLAELGDELNNVVTESRNILETAEKEGRNKETLLPAEQEKITKLTDQIGPIKSAQKTKQEFLNRLTDIDNTDLDAINSRRTPLQSTKGKDDLSPVTWNFLERPAQRMGHLQRSYTPTKILGSAEYNREFNRWLKTNTPGPLMAGSTGMSVSDDERGGYFTVSEVFSTELLKNVDDAVHVQRLSRVIMMPPGAQNYGIRVRRNKASSFRFSAENDDISDTTDTSLKYGKRVLTPNWLAGSCIISKELIRNYPGAEAMVLNELAIDSSEVLEESFLTGTGSMQPLGLLTASADGIDTDRDYTTGTSADFTFDDFVSMKFNLKIRYRNNARWMLHRTMLRDVCLLKDGNGQYLWQASRQVGEPDLILGLPFTESEWMPSTKTGGAYFIILGDFQYYYIVWDMNMQMQRLNELRAHTNEYEYLFRAKMDAQPVLPEAFVRGVFAA